jgi:hypothetical protein
VALHSSSLRSLRCGTVRIGRHVGIENNAGIDTVFGVDGAARPCASAGTGSTGHPKMRSCRRPRSQPAWILACPAIDGPSNCRTSAADHHKLRYRCGGSVLVCGKSGSVLGMVTPPRGALDTTKRREIAESVITALAASPVPRLKGRGSAGHAMHNRQRFSPQVIHDAARKYQRPAVAGGEGRCNRHAAC